MAATLARGSARCAREPRLPTGPATPCGLPDGACEIQVLLASGQAADADGAAGNQLVDLTARHGEELTTVTSPRPSRCSSRADTWTAGWDRP